MGNLFKTGSAPTKGKDQLWKKIFASEGSRKNAISKIDNLYSFYSDPSKIESKYFDLQHLITTLHNEETDKVRPLKVKLVIVDLEVFQDNKIAAFLVANTTAILGFSKYGLVHVGIQIGSHIIHWFNDSLVHFTDIGTRKKPRVAIDCGYLNMNDANSLITIKKLCKMCSDWCKTKNYDNRTCNCHHFSDQALDILGMKANFSGQLGKYLKELRTKGSIDKYFFHPKSNKKVIFNSHKELDTYCNQLFTEIPKFQEQYPEEYLLLKGFDRCYWVAFLKEQDEPDDKRDPTLEGFKCPFKNPYETFSFVPTKNDK